MGTLNGPQADAGAAQPGRLANPPPSSSLVVLSDFVLYLNSHADSVGSHRVAMRYLVQPGAMEEPLFEARMAMNMGAAMQITAPDPHVDELVQVGLQSKFARRGRCWRAHRGLNAWLVQRHRRAWTERKGAPLHIAPAAQTREPKFLNPAA